MSGVTPTAKAGPRLAVLFHRLGPYHWTRLTAAARRFELLAIEQSAETSEYLWEKVGGQGGFRRETLFASGERTAQSRTRVAARVRAALSRFAPAAVAVPGWSNAAALGALAWCAQTGVPAIVMSESTAIDAPRRLWWKEWPKRRLVGLGSAGLAGGTPHRNYLASLGMPPERVFLGYDAVDNEYFSAGADRARSAAGAMRANLELPARYFLASNRFLPQKNLSTLLDAFAAYRQKVGAAAWHLVLLGDGPLRAELEAQRDSLGLGSSLVLPGFKQYEELPAYYGLADAFVHAATSEPWGLVVNEALAAGLPAVVSERCGCAADLVREGHNGFRFDPTRPDLLAGLLGKVANASDDERATWGRAGREIVADWGPERFADGLERACRAARNQPIVPPRVLDRLMLRALRAW